MLKITIGQLSLAGRYGPNQDFLGCVTPDGEVLRDKGAAFVVADGVGRGKGGYDAAETAVRLFLSDYYSTPDTWSVNKCLEQVFEHVQLAVRKRGPGATTFASLILKGRRYFISHAGDSRVYRLRDGALTQLTMDHVWKETDFRNVVSRAVGLDTHLHPDYSQGELCEGDVFLLCSDGFYKSREPTSEFIQACSANDLQQVVEEWSGRTSGEDDVTLQLVRIDSLPSVDERETVDLPLADNVKEGVTLDDFYLVKRLHRGWLSEVYLADDLRKGRKVVLKFPVVNSGEEKSKTIDRFLREEWVGRRVRNPHVLAALPLETGRRSCLYYVTPWQSGEILRRQLERKGIFQAPDVVEIGIQICKGLEALHHLHVLHRDIKPDNILMNDQGRVLLLDLGVAQVESFASESDVPGTPAIWLRRCSLA